jgi:hypothetical protein
MWRKKGRRGRECSSENPILSDLRPKSLALIIYMVNESDGIEEDDVFDVV